MPQRTQGVASSPSSTRAVTQSSHTRPSPREIEVLRLLADGKISKQIGSVLGISTRTVETYRARLMLKLQVRSVAEVVRYAIRTGLVEP